VAIVTNGDVRSQAAKIAAACLGELVDAYCIAEAEGHWKPVPELFRGAADRCGCTMENAWMIGDNPVADIGGAAACGARTVWIPMGRRWPKDLNYRPDFEADTFKKGVGLVLQRAAAEGLIGQL
jgi:putative hydrolase of the HAD superfamily